MTTGTTGTQQLNDVTSGSNSVGSAGPGYDLVTGQGTPRRADLVYQAFVSTFSIGDPGFEQVVVGAGNFQYDPTGSPWTFSGSSGISGNNSGFTVGQSPRTPGRPGRLSPGNRLVHPEVSRLGSRHLRAHLRRRPARKLPGVPAEL